METFHIKFGELCEFLTSPTDGRLKGKNTKQDPQFHIIKKKYILKLYKADVVDVTITHRILPCWVQLSSKVCKKIQNERYFHV